MAKAKVTAPKTKTKTKPAPAKAPGALEQAPATTADATHAAGLGRAPVEHVRGPGLAKASLFASAEVQTLLRKATPAERSVLGIDTVALANAARDHVAAGLRTDRLVESANREFATYKALGAQTTKLETQLLNSIRGLAPTSTLKKSWLNALQRASSASGAPKVAQTKRAKAKATKGTGAGK